MAICKLAWAKHGCNITIVCTKCIQCAMYAGVYAPCTIDTCTCKQTAKYKQLEVCSHVWLHMLCAWMCKLHVLFNVSWIVSHTSLPKLCDQTSTWFACTEHAEMLKSIATHNQLEPPKQLCGCHQHKVWSLPYHQPSSSLHLGQSSLHWWYWHHHCDGSNIVSPHQAIEKRHLEVGLVELVPGDHEPLESDLHW